uniref:Putative secreted peptide n=1 Tax=Anopheles braziliensis TaxID=58242 RepID=A0A2M3ZNX1_9DIPT
MPLLLLLLSCPWTLYVILCTAFAKPTGTPSGAGTVGIVHDQYHIDQQPHERRQQHDPACIGAELAAKHSAKVDVGHFALQLLVALRSVTHSP